MEQCSLCKKSIPDGPSEVWTAPEGVRLAIGSSAEPIAVANTSVGELTICEQCLGVLPDYLLPEDLYEIHYQFGLDCRDHNQHERSLDSLHKALSFRRTADALAALAYAQNELGHSEEAVVLYEQALSADPNHFMSTENLKRLKGKLTNDSTVPPEGAPSDVQ